MSAVQLKGSKVMMMKVIESLIICLEMRRDCHVHKREKGFVICIPHKTSNMEDGSMQTRILMRDKKNNNKDREEVEIVMTLIVLAEDLLERWYCTD